MKAYVRLFGLANELVSSDVHELTDGDFTVDVRTTHAPGQPGALNISIEVRPVYVNDTEGPR